MPNTFSAKPARAYHEEPSTMQLHRAIGGYITVFSELITTMRNQISTFLAATSEDFVFGNPLHDILFSNMTANPIVDSFFAMSTQVGDLDDEDVRIRNSLKRSTQKQVVFRNDLAHADWSVGWVVHETSEPVPATAHKIKSRDGVPQLSDLNIKTNDIIHNINELNILRTHVARFGTICRARQRGAEQRVRDVLEVIPASAAGGTIVQEKRRSTSD